MDHDILVKEITKLNKNEEILICFKDKHLILILPDNGNEGVPVHSISTIGKNTIEINRTKFIDCNFVYYFERRLIENERIKHKLSK